MALCVSLYLPAVKERPAMSDPIAYRLLPPSGLAALFA